jgi:hypothetical protein
MVRFHTLEINRSLAGCVALQFVIARATSANVSPLSTLARAGQEASEAVIGDQCLGKMEALPEEGIGRCWA